MNAAETELAEFAGHAWYTHPERITKLEFSDKTLRLCPKHEGWAASYLRFLDLGCVGTPDRTTSKCDRCNR